MHSPHGGTGQSRLFEIIEKTTAHLLVRNIVPNNEGQNCATLLSWHAWRAHSITITDHHTVNVMILLPTWNPVNFALFWCAVDSSQSLKTLQHTEWQKKKKKKGPFVWRRRVFRPENGSKIVTLLSRAGSTKRDESAPTHANIGLC